MVAVPIALDQPVQAHLIAERGLRRVLDFARMTPEVFPSYRGAWRRCERANTDRRTAQSRVRARSIACRVDSCSSCRDRDVLQERSPRMSDVRACPSGGTAFGRIGKGER